MASLSIACAGDGGSAGDGALGGASAGSADEGGRSRASARVRSDAFLRFLLSRKLGKSLALGSARLVAILCVRALDSLPSVGLVGLVGCATYASELSRGQRAYEQGEDDRALAVLRELEPDVERLRGADRARYWYLRGMTDYRLGYKADARHWLALAAAVERTTPGSLSADWSATLADSLNDLDATVYRTGIASLFDGGAAPRPVRSVIEAADQSSGLLGSDVPTASDGGR